MLEMSHSCCCTSVLKECLWVPNTLAGVTVNVAIEDVIFKQNRHPWIYRSSHSKQREDQLAAMEA